MQTSYTLISVGILSILQHLFWYESNTGEPIIHFLVGGSTTPLTSSFGQQLLVDTVVTF